MTETRPNRSKLRPRILEVAEATRLTPHMRRIGLTGTDLLGWPTGREGANLKIFLPAPGQPAADFIAGFDEGRRGTVRTYTARRYDPVANRLDIDPIRRERDAADDIFRNSKPNEHVLLHAKLRPNEAFDQRLLAAVARWFSRKLNSGSPRSRIFRIRGKR